MNEIKRLANEFLITREQLVEKRRYIDHHMASTLKVLKKDNDGTVESTLRILDFESKVEAEESDYSQIENDLYDVVRDLKPLLIKVNATRENPLITHVNDRSYHDTYLDENGEVQNRGIYTDMTK